MVEITKASNGAEFSFNSFSGPLDLLLSLIKKNEINIYDIPIARITDEYVTYIKEEKENLDNLTDFYVLAATLIHIKSRMLLPIEFDFDEEYEDPRTELIEKLIEYQKYKKLTDLMQEKSVESEWLIERRRKQRVLPFEEKEDMWESLDVMDLLNTFSGMIKQYPLDLIDTEEVKVEEKVALIEEKISSGKEFYFTDLILVKTSMMEVICSFLAILNLVKEKEISLLQNKMFGDIKITKYKKAEPDLEFGENNE